MSSTHRETPPNTIFSKLLLVPSLLGHNIFLSTLFSNTLSPCTSLNMTNQVSHPYRTAGKIIVMYFNLHIPREQTVTQNVVAPAVTDTS